jgi:lipopolysaccharide/colanic/teichoic acid biosynthesis glycosyltransferase
VDQDVIARAGARALMDGAEVHLVLPGGPRPPVRTRTERIGPHTMITVRAVSDGTCARIVRRTIDVVAATMLLVLLGPVFALVALLVRWDLQRPILFAQERLGRSGRRFRLYKFRSMVAGADELLRQSPDLYRIYVASNFKLPENIDPRITSLGRFLRRTSLDELPQLWNVLRGDMTLVGPRPIVPDELVKYGEYGRMLLRVKPGLTGQWQVNGRSGVGYPERARIDLAYLAQRSLYQDLRILRLTVPAVLQRRGAT